MGVEQQSNAGYLGSKGVDVTKRRRQYQTVQRGNQQILALCVLCPLFLSQQTSSTTSRHFKEWYPKSAIIKKRYPCFHVKVVKDHFSPSEGEDEKVVGR